MAMTVEQVFKKHGLLGQRYRYEMDPSEEKQFADELFDAYEASGFVKKLPSFEDGWFYPEDAKYHGQPFHIVKRCDPSNVDLSELPAWIIEFEDGHCMTAYPDEICLAVTDIRKEWCKDGAN